MLLVVIPMALFSQQQVEIKTEGAKQVCTPDPAFPSYPGGWGEMSNFIIAHVSDSIKMSGVKGRVYTQITVDTSGNMTHFEILRGINDGFNKELARVFGIMPKWVPGEVDGRKIERTIALPVAIDLSGYRKDK